MFIGAHNIAWDIESILNLAIQAYILIAIHTDTWEHH